MKTPPIITILLYVVVGLIFFLIEATIMYLIYAFLNLEMDFRHWTVRDRLGLVLEMFAWLVIDIGIVGYHASNEIETPKNNEKNK